MNSIRCQCPPVKFKLAIDKFREAMHNSAYANGAKLSVAACASSPIPPGRRPGVSNKHVARDFLKMFSSEAKNNLITAKNSFELNINNLKKVGTKLSTII